MRRTRKLRMVKRDYVVARKVSPDFTSKALAKQFARRAKELGYARVKVEPFGVKWVVTFY